MRSVYWLLTVIVLACSCTSKNKVRNAVEGWWTIDTIYYKKYDIKVCLNLNSITFGDNGIAQIPTTGSDCQSAIIRGRVSETRFKIVYSDIQNDTIPFRIVFNSANEIFDGNQKIVFYRDQNNRLLKMEIYSDKLYLVCRKGLFNYNKNEGVMRDLEKITWSNRPY